MSNRASAAGPASERDLRHVRSRAPATRVPGLAVAAAVAVGVTAGAVSCVSILLPRETAARPGRRTAWRRTVEESGTVSVSAPLLSKPSEKFVFDLSAKPDDFYREAKSAVQGRTGEFDPSASITGFGASVSADSTLTAAHAGQVQQFFAIQTRNDQRHALLDQRLRLANTAARAELEEAMRRAVEECHPARKASMIADAQRQFAAGRTVSAGRTSEGSDRLLPRPAPGPDRGSG